MRLLDLFCCAGGGAKGYYQSGFEVVGVDHRPQPRYPYEFHQGDALEFLRLHGREFDCIHASPPCQAHCALKHLSKKEHPDFIAATRYLLEMTGLPYVMENVPGAPLINPAMLCGTMFGLRTDCGAELRRHRLFETNWPLVVDLKCNHYASSQPCTEIVHGHSGGSSRRDGKTISIAGHSAEEWPRRTICVNGTGQPTEGRVVITVTGSTPQQNVHRNVTRKCFPVSAARTAMGIDWMVMKELSQAIPPAYTYFIGPQLRQWILSQRLEAAV